MSIRKSARPVLLRQPLAAAISSMLLALCSMEASATDTESTTKTRASFDTRTLQARGIDPKVAEYFSEAPRFREGTHTVTLILNGAKLGLVDATFDENGQLCFDRALLEKAKLRETALVNPSSASDTANASGCYDFAATYPTTKVTLNPAQDEVALLVPTEAFQPGGYDLANAATGGAAGLLNYDLLGQSTRTSGQSSRYLYASTEVGANAGDWIMRSRQVYTSNDDRSRFEHVYAYAQRTFTSHKAIFQAGQINITSPLFTGAPISGVQIIPEGALAAQGSGPVVEGVAQSDARVDVRQAGALIYSTRVPAGPFALNDIPLLNGRTDLEVTVVEGDGAERKFIVPMASLNASSLPRTGYSLAAGKVRNISGIESTQPVVATAAGSWVVSKSTVASGGVMGGRGYQALGLGVDSKVATSTIVSARNTLSNASKDNARGVQTSFAINANLTGSLSAGASATFQTKGYRDLLDTTYGDFGAFGSSRYKSQFTGTLGWSHPTWGGLNLSYSSVQTFNGTTTGRFVGSWGKTFRHASVSASLETELGSSGQHTTRHNGNAFYVNVNIPLGSRNLRTYVNQRDDRLRTGATLSEKVNDTMNYRVAAEGGDGGTDLTGNVALTPRYTQINLGAGHYGSGSTSFFGQFRGGVALHDGGVTASPYPIQDTFGVLSVGDLSGVKVTTPYGPVWTDPWGKAVIPQLPAYKSSRVEVITKTLPRNVDIKNGFKTIEAGRGSVIDVQFDIVKTRRVLVTAIDDQGHPLAKGSSVMGPDNTFVTTVVDDGQLFLANAMNSEGLKVFLPDGKQCALNVTLPEKADEHAYYENAIASRRIL
ncbi:fimbrial biogenesis usher protein [Dyella subtropica]|uniref:fimbrial biogenesis usher protein n=1 Tax=Dyella subtropica TaxID=2992127 RepID=UPI0022506EDB|nr:fimbrial biogenesis usher protein [Dyella subtropica]